MTILAACSEDAALHPRTMLPGAYAAMAHQDSTTEEVALFCTELALDMSRRAFTAIDADMQRGALATEIFDLCLRRHGLS